MTDRVAAAFAAACLIAGCAACGDDPTASAGGASSSGGGGDGGTTASTTSSSSGSTSTTTSTAGGAGPCPYQEPPASVPEGWVEYGDWSCDCRFYLPPAEELMPPPIVWEPCPVSPPGVDCQRMVSDWTDGQFPVSTGNSLWVDPGGTPFIMFRRNSDDAGLNLVAEVDGPVRLAVYIPRSQEPGQAKCTLFLGQVNEGRYVMSAMGDGVHGTWNDSPYMGAIGGPLGQLRPDVLVRYDDGSHSTWFASSAHAVRGAMPGFVIEALPWSGPPASAVSSSALDPEHDEVGQEVAIGDAVFFDNGGAFRHGINVWDPQHGARPFVRWIGDNTRLAGDLGTDGVDLVWSYAQDDDPSELDYPIRSIMTAPFTTDPAALEPRRLRSLLGGIGAWQWRVGCGYATNRNTGNGAFVVRIADGVAWDVPSSADFVAEPFGITCDHVYSLGKIGDELTISRIRLDSLGPGIPPD